jgi:hypothetical protein
MPRNKQAKGLVTQDRVKNILRAAGREVEIMPYNCGYDLLVDGKHRVEVKVAEPQTQKDAVAPFWNFNIHRHGIIDERCDLYVLVLTSVPYCTASTFLLLEAPIGKHTMHITYRDLFQGRWADAARNYDCFRSTGKFLSNGGKS